MTTKTKNLSYNGYKNLLNRVAYKLLKSKVKYKHSKEYKIGKTTKTYEQIIKTIKENGTNYKNDEFIARFIEDVDSKNNYEILPTSVMGSSGKNKYYRGMYREMIKNVLAYRKKNSGANPESLKVRYERIEILYDFLTNQGCKGMGQCNGHNCACNSLQQAFYRLTGILVDEKTIAGWAGTTSDGTDHVGINTAVAKFNKKYGKNVKIEWYNFSELSWDKIKEMLKKGAIFFHLLYRLKWGHYEPIMSIGDTLKILNSLGDYCNYPAYCGYIETRTKATQKQYINGISQKSVAFLYNG